MKTPDLIKTIEIKDKTGKVIGTKDVVTYPGLLSKAHEEGLNRIATKLLQIPTEENGRTAIARALVETAKGHFSAIGDASPENVNSFIVPHLIRVAETRAKARALRDAVNIGIVSFEELDGESFVNGVSDPGSGPANGKVGTTPKRSAAPASRGNGANDGATPLMSDSQRRYLFRLLAGQGIKADEAHKVLKEHFCVVALSEVTRTDASVLIDRLVKGEEMVKIEPLNAVH